LGEKAKEGRRTRPAEQKKREIQARIKILGRGKKSKSKKKAAGVGGGGIPKGKEREKAKPGIATKKSQRQNRYQPLEKYFEGGEEKK